MKTSYFIHLPILLLLSFFNSAYGISLDEVVCPANHSPNQTNNILSERLYLNDSLAHSVFKIRGLSSDSDQPFDDLGTATLIYKSNNGDAFFITAEHVFKDPNYTSNAPGEHTSVDSHVDYYLYAPGMSSDSTVGQILIEQKYISYWGQYKYGNNKYCEYQGGEDSDCPLPPLEEQAGKIKNPDIAVFKVENFNWDSKPVNIDLKFGDIELDGVLHLLGYPVNSNYPVLISNILPMQNFGIHYSPSHIYEGQSGSLLVSDFGVGYAIQSKYEEGSNGSDAKKVFVTPFSEVMDFIHSRLYGLSAEGDEVVANIQSLRKEKIKQFFKKILPNSPNECEPEDSACHVVDVRKINLLLRQDWNYSLNISLIIRDELWKALDDKKSPNMTDAHKAVEVCRGELITDANCRSQLGFSLLENQLLSMGANLHNRRSISQMLECTIGKDNARIYVESSRLLATLYTALVDYTAGDTKVLILASQSNTGKTNLLGKLIERQREEISNRITDTLIKKSKSIAGSNIFRNVTKAKEISEIAVNLAGLAKSACKNITENYITATNRLNKKPVPDIRGADGFKSSGEQKSTNFGKVYEGSVESVNKVKNCYLKSNEKFHRDRKSAIAKICKYAIGDKDYYDELPRYTKEAINECFRKNVSASTIAD